MMFFPSRATKRRLKPFAFDEASVFIADEHVNSIISLGSSVTEVHLPHTSNLNFPLIILKLVDTGSGFPSGISIIPHTGQTIDEKPIAEVLSGEWGNNFNIIGYADGWFVIDADSFVELDSLVSSSSST